jgi:hypothetical protein
MWCNNSTVTKKCQWFIVMTAARERRRAAPSREGQQDPWKEDTRTNVAFVRQRGCASTAVPGNFGFSTLRTTTKALIQAPRKP